MDDKEKTVGAILKEARLAKGISLADAEKATSIRSRYLQAVENDEYDKTPGEVFLKGIIRNYGNYLGLNGPELVNEYKASAAGMAAEAVRSQGIREVEKVRLNIQLKDKRDIGSGTGRLPGRYRHTRAIAVARRGDAAPAIHPGIAGFRRNGMGWWHRVR